LGIPETALSVTPEESPGEQSEQRGKVDPLDRVYKYNVHGRAQEMKSLEGAVQER
jgi:hypothetical protein